MCSGERSPKSRRLRCGCHVLRLCVPCTSWQKEGGGGGRPRAVGVRRPARRYGWESGWLQLTSSEAARGPVGGRHVDLIRRAPLWEQMQSNPEWTRLRSRSSRGALQPKWAEGGRGIWQLGRVCLRRPREERIGAARGPRVGRCSRGGRREGKVLEDSGVHGRVEVLGEAKKHVCRLVGAQVGRASPGWAGAPTAETPGPPTGRLSRHAGPHA